MCARLSFDRYYALRVFVWGVLWSTSLYTRVRRLSREGFSLFQLDKKKNGTRIPIAHTTQNARRSGEEHKKRTLSVLQTKAFRNNKARRPKRKRRGRPKAKSYYGVLSKDTEKNQRQKKDLLYNMFRVCKRGSLLLLFFCASVRLSLIRTPFFSSPPLFRPRRVEASSP